MYAVKSQAIYYERAQLNDNANDIYTEMGKLYRQIQDDKQELGNYRECGNRVAQQLRVIADCLDTRTEYKALSVLDNPSNSFHNRP